MTTPMTLTDQQWSRITQTVHDEALKSRVAASFLPLFGPLDPDVQTVPRNTLFYEEGDTAGSGLSMKVLDFENIRLATVSINVYLKNAQIADPELASAMIMFRRAAEIMARVEDSIIFNGQSGIGEGPNNNQCTEVPPVFSVSGGEPSNGLVGAGMGNAVEISTATKTRDAGQQVFEAIVARAIPSIERAGYHGPFACVLGYDLFAAITTPMPSSMVLPRDSLLPFLDAPLLRSTAMPPDMGVIVSLRGAPVEIVVPSDITVRHLQTTADAQHLFRVQQKFVLRVKEAGAVSTFGYKLARKNG